MSLPIGSIIRNARLRRRLSVRAAAEAAGIPASTLQRVEEGSLNAPGARLQRLAHAVGLRVSDLVPEIGRRRAR